MLNELIGLTRSLNEFGVETPRSHPAIKEVRKAAFLRVLLDAQGVAAVEACDVESMPLFASWTLRDGQQNSFPAISAKSGIVAEPDTTNAAAAMGRDEDGKKADVPLDTRIEAINALASGPIDPDVADGWPGYVPRIAERAGELKAFQGGEHEPVWLAFERFSQLAADDSVGLLSSLASAVAKAASAGDPQMVKLAGELLAGSGGQLYFDVVETRSERPVGHVERRGAVATTLAAFETEQMSEADRAAAAGLCMLTGQQTELHEGNYPQPNLPYLGQTYLYSRNSDTPSAARYGETKQSVGRELVMRLGGAIDWMCGQDGRGTRWTSIAGERDGLNDLLLSYAAIPPDVPLVSLFAKVDEPEDPGEAADKDSGGDADEIDQTELVSDFERQSRKVIEALETQRTVTGQVPSVSVVMLRQVDPANRKAVYTVEISGELAIAAAVRWNEIFAAAEVPPITVVMPPKTKGERPIIGRLRPFKPLSLVELSRRSYVRGGTDRQDVVGLPAAAAMGLFLQDDARPIAVRFLRRLVRQLGELVAGYAAADRIGLEARRDFDAFAVRRTLSAFHLLLARLGRSGTDYMTSPAYRLGQFLAACDTLHLGYCLDQRNGSIPPKLLGNAHVATAGRSPVRALGMLQRRVPVYKAWADKVRSEGRGNPSAEKTEKAKREAYAIRNGFFAPVHLARLAPELKGELPNAAPDDAFRAELLLGYAAGPDRIGKSHTDDSDTGKSHTDTSNADRDKTTDATPAGD